MNEIKTVKINNIIQKYHNTTFLEYDTGLLRNTVIKQSLASES